MTQNKYRSQSKELVRNWAEWTLLLLGIVLMSHWFFEDKWFMTFDGPAHVGNTRIMTSLLLHSNESIGQYYQFTDFPQPNWTGHFVMMCFSFFMEGAAAEKITLFLLLVLQVFSFRYFLRSFVPDSNANALLILPVSFGMFLYSGSYNFCYSLVFLLLSVGYLQRHLRHLHLTHVPAVMALSGLTYFSHISALPVLALASGGLLLFHVFENKSMRDAASWRIFLQKAVWLAMAHLPFIVLVVMYQSKFGGDHYFFLPFSEVLTFLLNGQSLVAFGADDFFYTRIFTGLLYGMFVLVMFIRIISSAKLSRVFYRHDVFLLLAFFLLLLIFVLPDSDSQGGMMTTRLMIFHYLFLLSWLCLHKNPWWTRLFFPLLVLVLTFFKAGSHSQQMNYQRIVADEVQHTAEFVSEGDVVLPINRGDHWLTVNHPLLLAADKAVVVIENYEVWHGYFPITDARNTPAPAIPPRTNQLCEIILPLLQNGSLLPDHVFVLEQKKTYPCDTDLQFFIENHYELKYSSQVCSLYSLKKQ